MLLLLKIRIIPTLLYKSVGLVKGIGFDSWRVVDTVLPAIKVYNLREVDELILLDIAATSENRDPDYESIKEFSQECFVPFAVGGGINNIEHIKQLLRVGADKVVINSSAYQNIEFIRECAEIFGSQCIIASIDAKMGADNQYSCYSHCGTVDTGIEVSEWAKTLEAVGVGEIIITSITRDGTMNGYDLELIKKVSENVKIPVIASGGAGDYIHMEEALKYGGASAVAAASMFHFTERTPKEAKRYLSLKGFPVRKVQ